MAYVTPDILQEDWDSVTGWDDGDINGAVSEIDPAGQLYFNLIDLSGAGYAYREKDFGSIGSGDYYVEIKFYADPWDRNSTTWVGMWLKTEAATNKLEVRFGNDHDTDGDGLWVYTGVAWVKVIAKTWDTNWHTIVFFVHNSQTDVDIWIDKSPFEAADATDADCSAATGTDGTVRLGGTGSVAGDGEYHTDYLYIGSEIAVDVEVTPTVLTSTFSTQAPAITEGTGNTETPVVQTATFTIQTPAVEIGITISPPVFTSTFSIQAPTITYDYTTSPSVLSVTFAIQAPTVVIPITISPTVLTATFTIQVPVISLTSHGVDTLDYNNKYASPYLITVNLVPNRYVSETFKKYIVAYVSKPTGTDIGVSYLKNKASPVVLTTRDMTDEQAIIAHQNIDVGLLQLKLEPTVRGNSAPKIYEVASHYTSKLL